MTGRLTIRIVDRRIPLLGVFVTLGCCAAAPAATPRPAEFLAQQRGLCRVGDQRWELPLEARLRERLGELPDLKRDILAAEKDLGERIAENERLWPAVRPQLAALRRQAAQLASDDPRRQRWEQELRQLARVAVPPRRLGERADVKARLTQLSDRRSALTIAVFWIREALPQLAAAYERLRADPAVSEALGELGHRLSGTDRYARQIRELVDYEKLVSTPWVPLYRQSGRQRFAGLVNDQTPATFSWRGDGQRTLLSANLAESAGLSASGPPESLEVGGRRFAVVPVTLAYLRFGSHLLRDVKAYILPPEAADLGSEIGPAAFAPRVVRLEPERLRLTVRDPD